MKTVGENRHFYKDTLRKKISGVCAGIARHFGFDPLWVRAAAIVAFIAMPVPVVFAYLVAVLLLPNR
jgi:phage shock protein PspC (stress-responsive transcriptional regulator)